MKFYAVFRETPVSENILSAEYFDVVVINLSVFEVDVFPVGSFGSNGEPFCFFVMIDDDIGIEFDGYFSLVASLVEWEGRFVFFSWLL